MILQPYSCSVLAGGVYSCLAPRAGAHWVTSRCRLRVAVRCAAALSNPGSFNPDQEQRTPVPELDDVGRDAHRKFMAFVRDLILGEREPSQFEDDVRALLGESRCPAYNSSLPRKP